VVWPASNVLRAGADARPARTCPLRHITALITPSTVVRIALRIDTGTIAADLPSITAPTGARFATVYANALPSLACLEAWYTRLTTAPAVIVITLCVRACASTTLLTDRAACIAGLTGLAAPDSANKIAVADRIETRITLKTRIAGAGILTLTSLIVVCCTGLGACGHTLAVYARVTFERTTPGDNAAWETGEIARTKLRAISRTNECRPLFKEFGRSGDYCSACGRACDPACCRAKSESDRQFPPQNGCQSSDFADEERLTDKVAPINTGLRGAWRRSSCNRRNGSGCF